MAPTMKWDVRFLEMAALVGSWSKDPSSKLGCVIVRPDRTVASLGYNGFPRGVADTAAAYADREQKLAQVIHAEMNAILSADVSVKGCTLYIGTAPCDRCTAHIIQAGIKRVVYRQPDAGFAERWADSLVRSRAMFDQAGIQVSEYAN